ncbi:hypothetical protein DF186_21505, partial [Enterococcus hirae]
GERRRARHGSRADRPGGAAGLRHLDGGPARHVAVAAVAGPQLAFSVEVRVAPHGPIGVPRHPGATRRASSPGQRAVPAAATS